MAELASRNRPARGAGDGGATGLAPLRLNYYSRMKPHRVYPWTVTWPLGPGDRKGSDQELTVRLIMAGAQVVPAEQTLIAAAGQNQATFYVTPIAKGWLKGQRLEVLMGGRKVQEIPLSSKAVSQRRTWMLLLLTFLAPWFIWSVFHFPLLEYRTESRDSDLKKVEAKFVETNDVDLTNGMVAHVKEVIAPSGDIKEHLSQEAIDFIEKETPTYVVSFYQEFGKTIRQCKVGLFAGLGFFLLTLGSWFCRRQRSTTLVGRPIPQPGGGD